ncbi:MAG: DNA-binding protein [Methanosarcinaceae archaeon]|nr:DNA-binding protein [Methanosarcinaceae archaeon]
MGKLEHKSDLLESLTNICNEKNIHLGRLEVIGAVIKARLGYYNQNEKEYNFIEIDKKMEITSLIGNISLKDGKPIVHAHINLSDSTGNVIGGHLATGTIVFASEFVIQTFDGANFSRGLDNITKLPLWTE